MADINPFDLLILRANRIAQLERELAEYAAAVAFAESELRDPIPQAPAAADLKVEILLAAMRRRIRKELARLEKLMDPKRSCR